MDLMKWKEADYHKGYTGWEMTSCYHRDRD